MPLYRVPTNLWEAYVAEKSWTGMPLYKDTPYNKDMPEWTKRIRAQINTLSDWPMP